MKYNELLVPMLCIGMPSSTLRVVFGNAERPRKRYQAEHGNEQVQSRGNSFFSQFAVVPIRIICVIRVL